jgi:protein-S-isoprenylcysteine O-methyltransferase Ste14
LGLAILFSIIFTISSLFIMFSIIFMLNDILEEFIKDPWYVAVGPTHNYAYQQEYDAIVASLKPIGYICFLITILLIFIGLILKRYQISLFGSYVFYIPLFGQFSIAMSALFAGIGVFRIIWMPFFDIESELLNAAAIILLPFVIIPLMSTLVFLIIFYLNLEPDIYYTLFVIDILLMFALILLGLFIFMFSVVTWFYGKFQRKKIINFWIYRYSRHPQYLGLILFNYGLLIFPITLPFIRISLPTLPWLVVTLIIIGMAINEENKFLNENNEKFINWRNKTPFMIPLPKVIMSLLLIPVRILLKKDWPETNKEIIFTLLIYGFLVLILSLPFIPLMKGY